MADNSQLPPYGDMAGSSAMRARPGPLLSRATLTAAALVIGGALLGLLGGLIWATVTPRVVYQVASLRPPTAYAINPETSAFIAADGIYTFIALAGGALLGLAGYLTGVRRYALAPMVGLIAGSIAAAFLAKWLGTLLTGGQTFDSRLAGSKIGALLRAPITLGSHGALVFWPVAAALTAGIPELVSYLRARRLALSAARQAEPGYGLPLWDGTGRPASAEPGPAQPSPGGWPPPPARPASSAQPWFDRPPDAPPGRFGTDPTGQSADLDQ